MLTLFSYPLHPPGKPERARTEHLPRITVPTVFTHGTADPFGTIDELRAAAALIRGAHRDRRDHRRPPRPGLQDARTCRRSRSTPRCGCSVTPADRGVGHYLHGMTSPPGPPPGYQPYPQPGYDPYGQYGQPPAPYPAYPTKPGTNGFAIAALILGIIGAVLLSVIFGIIALNQTKGGRQGGRGMAIAGLIISGVWVFVIAAVVVVAIVFDDGSVQATDVKVGDCIADAPADGANVIDGCRRCRATNHTRARSTR